jgi:hypothetical protein
MVSRTTIGILLLGSTLIVAGCGGSKEKSQPAALVSAAPVPPIGPMTPPPSSVTRFTDIPVPPDNTVDLERTVMVGGEADWLGRVLFSTPMETAAVWEFYRREMPRYGWHEIAAHWRPTNSVLFFQLNNRVATIELSSRAGITQIEFWMNPRSSNSPGASTLVVTPSLASGAAPGEKSEPAGGASPDRPALGIATAAPPPEREPASAVEETALPPPP